MAGKYDKLLGEYREDDSSSGVTLPVTDTTTQTSEGYALYFDGVNDYGKITRNATLDALTTFSVRFWTKLDPVQQDYTMYVTKYGTDDNHAKFQITRQSSTPTFEIRIGNGTTTAFLGGATSVNDNIWHHCVMTVNDTTKAVKMYIDGVLDINRTYTGSISTEAAGDIEFMSRNGGTINAKGYIGKPSIVNFEMTQANVTANYNAGLGVFGSVSDTGLVVGYNLTEGTGTNADDYSTNDWDMTISGAVWKAGHVGQTVAIDHTITLLSTEDGTAVNEQGVAVFGDVDATTKIQGKNIELEVDGQTTLGFDSGNVGVGTATPFSKLSVDGGGSNGLSVVNNGTPRWFTKSNGGFQPATNSQILAWYNSGNTKIMQINGNDELHIVSGALYVDTGNVRGLGLRITSNPGIFTDGYAEDVPFNDWIKISRDTRKAFMPKTDGTTAINFTKADGTTSVLTLDTTNKRTVASGDVEVTDLAKGVVLKSPDGTRWRISVSNAGVLTTVAI
jgi:hypothetical protein